VEEKFNGDTKIFNDMPQMVAFVYEMYMEKVKALAQVKPAEEAPKQLNVRDKIQPTPIIFEETFVIEKPGEVIGMDDDSGKAEAMEVDDSKTQEKPEPEPNE